MDPNASNSTLSLKGTAEYEELSFDSAHELLITADLVAAAVNQKQSRAPLDLVAVVDISFSMTSQLPLVKETLEFMISSLGDNDRLSIVTFGSSSTVALHPTYINVSNRSVALAAVRAIEVNGATFLSGGLMSGIAQLRLCNRPESVKSVMLFTDGEPTSGIKEPQELGDAAFEAMSEREWTKTGSIYTFGYGNYHNAALLRAVADTCRGMYYFVQNNAAIKAAFGECLGGLLSVVARDVVLHVHPVKGVSVKKVMTKFPSTVASDGHYEISVGELYADERRNIPILLGIPKLAAVSAAKEAVCHLKIKYIDVVKKFNLTLEDSISLGRPEGAKIPVDRTPQSKALDEQRNRITVAEAVERATELGNAGKVAEARKILQTALDQIDVSISGQDNFSQQLVRDLKQCIANIDPSTYQHVGSKYMYSLSRSLYTQRSSGISSGAAAAFATSAQKAMIQQMRGGAPAATSSSSSSSSYSSSSSSSSSYSTSSSSSSSSSTSSSSSSAKPTQTAKSSAASSAVPSSSSTLQKPASAQVAPARPAFSQQTIARAVKRLMADLEEIMKNPLPSVVALPLEDDVFEWHCSIRGPSGSPYAGTVFHLILQFPENYPFKPPTLYFCSFIEHAHVFGSYVCLDMLQEAQFSSDEETNKPYTGWSSAYSVQSILLQLQAFLFDEAKRDKTSVQKAATSARRFKCSFCTHSHDKVWPPMKPVKPESYGVTASAGASKTNAFVPQSRLARAPTRAIKPKPRPVSAATVAKVTREIKSTSSQVAESSNATPVQRSVKIVEDAWQVVVSKRTLQMQKRIESLGYDPRLRNQLAQEKANAAKVARKNKTESSKKRPAAATSVSQDEDAPVAPAAPRVVVGGEMLIRKVAAPAPIAPVKPAAGALSKEEKKKLRNQAKAKARSEKRKKARIQAPTSSAQSSTETKQPPATVPVSVDSDTEESDSDDDNENWTVIAKAKPVTTPVASQQQQSNAKRVDLSRFILPSVLETELEKEFAAIMADSTVTGIDSSLFGFLSDELIFQIFSFLLPVELNDVGIVCKDFLRLGGDKRLWRGLFIQRYRPALRLGSEFTKFSVSDWKLMFTQENTLGRAGLQCYHSKASFRDAILGVPIVVDRRARFDELMSPFELLSLESYNDAQVRKSVWGLPFTHWLPVWIDNEHGERAWPEVEKAIAALSFRTGGIRFDPEMALSILPRLMNSLVVSVMSGNLHASIKALEGYCGFHRLLLAFVQRYPQLLNKINKRAREFVKHDSCRNKQATPNLGEFLPLLTVATSVSWKDVAIPYLLENFDRNVLWAIKKYPGLASPSQTERTGGADEGRLKKTFDATIVSMRLLCFHVYFFQLARPDGVSLDELATNYDAFFGVPSTQMKEALQTKIFEVLHHVNDWKSFFTAIGMKQPEKAILHKWLLQSVDNSARKGYHTNMKPSRK